MKQIDFSSIRKNHYSVSLDNNNRIYKIIHKTKTYPEIEYKLDVHYSFLKYSLNKRYSQELLNFIETDIQKMFNTKDWLEIYSHTIL